MKHFFLDRKFPEKLINTCIEKAIETHRNNNKPRRKEPIPLILTYNLRYPREQAVLAKNCEWLEHDEIGKKLASEFKPMVCFRRPRNLKELLTHADVKRKNPPR